MTRVQTESKRRPSGPLIVGIDIGTTYIKAGIYDAGLSERGSFSTPTPIEEGGSRVEADPDALWDVVRQQLIGVARRFDAGAIAAIGLTGMAESGFLMDTSNRPITPMLLWHDRRGTRQAAAWKKSAGSVFASITGVKLTNVRSLAKWRWLADAGAPRDARWCGAPEWIALRLTGRWLTDPTLAVRTGAFDVLRGEYSPEVLDLAGAPKGLFAPVGGLPTSAGRVLPEVAEELGLARATRVVIAGHDHLVAAYGAGGQVDDLIDSAGTAEALIRILPAAPAPVQAVQARMAMARYFLEGSWALIAGAGATGALMRQVAVRLGAGPGLLDLQVAAEHGSQESTLRVRLSERGLPQVEIDPRATAPEVWSAALDVVCSRMARTAKRLEQLAGRPRRAILIGGAAGSGELAARKRQALGVEVVPLPRVNAATRGAAALAAAACGLSVAIQAA